MPSDYYLDASCPTGAVRAHELPIAGLLALGARWTNYWKLASS